MTTRRSNFPAHSNYLQLGPNILGSLSLSILFSISLFIICRIKKIELDLKQEAESLKNTWQRLYSMAAFSRDCKAA